MIIPHPEFDRLGLIGWLEEHARETGNINEALMRDGHNPPAGEWLLHALRDAVQDYAGRHPLHGRTEETIYPRNCYGRIANRGAEVIEHEDHTNIDFVVSVNVLRDAPWYLEAFVHDKWLAFNDAHGAVLLRGNRTPHRRLPYRGERAYQLFLNYTLDPEGQNRAGGDEPIPPQFAVVRGVLTPEEIARFDGLETENAQLGDSRVETKVRKSRTAFLDDRERWGWLFDRLNEVMHRQNAEWPRIDMRAGVESIQYTEYGPGGHYAWHTDRGDASERDGIRRRTLSMSLALEDAEAGGGVEIRHGGLPDLKPGDAAIFRADEEHRALPVERGTRRVLVAWACEP